MLGNVSRWLRQLHQPRSGGRCGPRMHGQGHGQGHGHGHGHGHGCGPRGGPEGLFGGGGGGGFGVRRPLRFLGHRLGLADEQIAALARILDDLKTERAQAAVDERRTAASLADLLIGEAFDEAAAEAAALARVASATRLQRAVVKALSQVHALLGEGQRAKLATLIRGGVLSI